jgi:ABC-type lipoprotein export system ATPase subunit
VNGSGKTSLLKLIMGQLAPDGGRVKRGSTVRTAMLTQEVRELDEVADLRVQEAVEKVRGSVRIGDRDVTAGQMLENLGFARERVWTPVRELSGGERRRLQLLRLLMGEPNVLALDEPTNDLDTDTLAAVEDALDGWPGTLLVVSHDRYLLERICDRQVALLGDGRIRDLPGGVEEYLALRRARPRPGPGARARPPAGATPARRARSWPAWSGSCPGSPRRRRSCTPRWPRRRRTTRPCWRSTPGCANCTTSAPPSRSSGSRPPKSPADSHPLPLIMQSGPIMHVRWAGGPMRHPGCPREGARGSEGA